MNYRHAFHSGNFADVFKHAVLLALLDALTAKNKPLCYMDTHAGAGMYALDETRAEKTGEWRDGVARVFEARSLPEPLHRYRDAIRAFNRDGALRVYPGSPAIAAHALRKDDRLLLCEIQDEEALVLRERFRADKRVHVHKRDGYAAMNALLPPPERRGLALLDPPFEQQAEEFRVIEAALQAAHARWPTGVYAVWYPIKKRAAVMPFQRWLAAREWRDVLMAELQVQSDDSPLRLNGCGMVIVNAPWQFDSTVARLLPALRELLAQGDGATQRLQILA